MVENVRSGEDLLAIILRVSYKSNGITFFTPKDFSQQLGYMMRPAGYVIEPHVHNTVSREVLFTQEVLLIKSGTVRVDFFDKKKVYLESRLLFAGDVILLASGGHGFYMMERSEVIEVKQGPFVGESDKTRFASISLDQVRFPQ
jgi:hypothetical protein